MSSVDHCPSCRVELCDCYESVPWDRYKAVFDRSAGLQDRNVKKAQEIAELKAEVESLKHFIQEREDCIIFPSMLTQLGLKTRAERKAQRGGE